MSEMCTKMSLPPSAGVMNPWPLDREKYLQTPLKVGPCDARAVAEQVRARRVGRGLGTRKSLMGDGERSRMRHLGGMREVGEFGDGKVSDAPCWMGGVASEDMTPSLMP